MSRQKNILVVILLAGIAVFSAYKYLSALKEKESILTDLKQVQDDIMALESERQDLMGALGQEKKFKEQIAEHNTALQENLKIYADQLIQLKGKLAQIQNRIVELNAQLPMFGDKNTVLQEERSKLKDRISQIREENEEYFAQINSLSGLQKAVKDLKAKTRQVHKRIEKISQLSPVRLVSPVSDYLQGNKGFILLDGRSTYPTQAQTEIIPAWPADQSYPSQ